MTEINNIADLVRVLRENPEWLYTLRGIIVSDDKDAIPESLQAITARLDSMSETLGTVREEVTGLSNRVDQLDEKVTGVSNRVDKVDENVTGLSSRVDQLDEKITSVSTKQDETNQSLTTVSGRLNDLTGADYEGHAARVTPRRMTPPGDYTGIVLQYRHRHYNADWLENLATKAMIEGVLTKEQADDLPRIDLVFAITYRNGDQSLAAVEASLTVQTHAVERASRRAAVLARIQDLAVSAMTVGAAIEPQAAELATATGVTHVELEWRDAV